jgi:hypothetical protein
MEKKRGEADPNWVTGVHLGYPLLRESGAELRRAGVDFIDASMLFEKHAEDIYSDSCHFRHGGNALLAEAIAAELLRRLPGEK